MSFYFLTGDSSLAWDHIKSHAKEIDIIRFDKKLATTQGRQLLPKDILRELSNKSLFGGKRIIAITNVEDIPFFVKGDNSSTEEEILFRESFINLCKKDMKDMDIFFHWQKPKKNMKIYKNLQKIHKPKIFKSRENTLNSFSWVNLLMSKNKKALSVTHSFLRDGIKDKSGKLIKNDNSILQMLMGALSWKLRETMKKRGPQKDLLRQHQILVETDQLIREGRKSGDLLKELTIKWIC